MVKELRLIETLDSYSQSLPLFRELVALPRIRRRRSVDRFFKVIRLNKYVVQILDRLPQLGVEAWLTSGSLVQTAWNVKTRRRPYADIEDYDLIYYDPDLSWEAEDAIIRRAAVLFADLPIEVQIRNQARVPLWYTAKFNIRFPPVREAPHALRRYPSRTTAIAVTLRISGQVVFYAPFGFTDAFEMRVRPNRRLAIPHVYAAKANRWRAIWPQLTVYPWLEDECPAQNADVQHKTAPSNCSAVAPDPDTMTTTEQSPTQLTNSLI